MLPYLRIHKDIRIHVLLKKSKRHAPPPAYTHNNNNGHHNYNKNDNALTLTLSNNANAYIYSLLELLGIHTSFIFIC